MDEKINIEVVYANPTSQQVVNLQLMQDSTIKDAIFASGLYTPAMGNIAVGIFGKLRSMEYKLQDGDRIEIYTALLIDPKEARRQRAKRNKKPKKIRFKNPDAAAD